MFCAALSASVAAEKPDHSLVAAPWPDSADGTSHRSGTGAEAADDLGVGHNTGHRTGMSPGTADLESSLADHIPGRTPHTPADSFAGYHILRIAAAAADAAEAAVVSAADVAEVACAADEVPAISDPVADRTRTVAAAERGTAEGSCAAAEDSHG